MFRNIRLKLRMFLATALTFGLLYLIITLVASFFGVHFYQFYILLGLLMIVLQYLAGPKIVELTMKVRYVSEAEEPELHNMISQLAQAAGIPKPRVGISEIPIPNAFAFGKTKKDGRICVTSGIVGLLSPNELRAVLGHEMSHIQHNDMIVTTLISAVPLICYYIGMSLVFSRGDNNGAGIIVGIIAIGAYFLGQLLVLLVSRIREYYADSGSVALGCPPEDLASALYKLVQGSAGCKEEDVKEVKALKTFFANNVSSAKEEITELSQIDLNKDGSISRDELIRLKNNEISIKRSSAAIELFSTHPDMIKRIKKLSEMT